MKIRELLGMLALAAGVACVILGIGAVARDLHLGWLGIGVGMALNAGAYRMMLARKSNESPGSDDAGSEA
mgnify:CR=1 FL=1